MEFFNVLANCMDISVPDRLVNIVSTVITALYIGVPLLLIIFGMLDLGKAVMQSKEDDIKKAQSTFIKRIIAAAIVFFVVAIVKLVVGVVADGGQKDSIINCIDLFTNGTKK